MKKKGRFLVVEARRFIPLLFLLVLLIGLTVYDNFFRVEPTAVLPETDENSIAFTTTDLGELTSPTSFNLVADHEEWVTVSQELGLSLPDYPFNAEEELAVFAVNSEIQNMEILPRFGEIEIRVLVEPKDNYFHVVTVDRRSVELEDVVWKFVDDEDRVLSRIVPFWQVEEDDDAAAEEEEEEVIK
ncbi:MAG: hypothetical protein GX996_03555 [Firmicutes bacterium]|nr:hypothetical protein [Bacillota bacterium]